ncbi:hypothetical protein SDRG_00026 [Saprolegnia diclina VS20]|uniref:SGNH domain-containing protein n=1 Tax=Saprolegnia diclina (strain VS20) TaxID=1156394 RepID=T0SH33_SAPDV|nr:hypothetical protein SDRG_00026 [Saprolegnia diclina VS20]EQC42287.1 hypothetical protein SDRG_00026 [Saprolegnia diclina VS20]|eukprot:XP_008603710.1 hypothetical protein SDRG_00026 [Saprolegnia diclina VS20]
MLRPSRNILLQLNVLTASFALNIALLGVGGNNKMSFYLPFPRFWQRPLVVFSPTPAGRRFGHARTIPLLVLLDGALLALLGAAAVNSSSWLRVPTPFSTYVTGVDLPKDFVEFADHADKKSPETCVVLRPGGEARNGLLFVIGDSHADMLKPRFVQLATKNGRPEFHGYLTMYLNPGNVTHGASTPVCCAYAGLPCTEQSIDDVEAILSNFSSALQELRALGNQVFVADQSPQSGRQNPNMWLNGGDGVVPPPLSRAEYNALHAWLLTRNAHGCDVSQCDAR